MRAYCIGCLLVVGASTLAGCLSMSADMEPAQGANEVPAMKDAAQDEDHGVRVVAAAQDWPGPAYITEAITPLYVAVHNDSDHPVCIRFSDFELHGASKTYHAVPPLSIHGKVDVSRSRSARLAPGFDYDGFEVAPIYAPLYPDIGAYEGAFYYDEDYFDLYYPYWRTKTDLPTREMIDIALPEGVVAPHGYVSGWVYFQHVDEQDVPMSFKAALRAPDDSAVSEVDIPFETE